MSKRILAAALGAFVLGVLLSWRLQGLRLSFSAQPEDNRPQRIICMSPSVTEIVFALGQGHRVVGVSQFTTYPPEALAKPQCGGFINPNLELIVSLRPDVVLTQGLARKLLDYGHEHGIKVVCLTLDDLPSIFVDIMEVGRILECRPQAERLCDRMRWRLEWVKRKAKGRRRPRVLVVIGREPDSLKNLLTIGRGSFLNDLLELAGGQNVFADVAKPYPTISKESLLERQPEVIIELQGEGMIGKQQMARLLDTWSSMFSLPAVKNRKVYAVGSTYALIPGPRVVNLAEKFADILDGAIEDGK